MNRKDFPLLEKYVYLDSAAGVLKPTQVANAIKEFYLDYPVNPHSVNSPLGNIVSSKIKKTRKITADLIDAAENEIIFTSGTTDSINRFARMIEPIIKPGDEILLSKYNHSSNMVPWMELAKRKNAVIVYAADIVKAINSKTKIVAFAQVNNTIHKHVDIDLLYSKVKENGALLINDAAQAIVKEKVSLHDSDVVVFSGNKIYGPTGTGVLAIKQELLSLLKTVVFGGGSTSKIFSEKNEWLAYEGVPSHEAGTPNTAGIIGLGVAIEYFNNVDTSNEKIVSNYLYDKLRKMNNVKIYSKRGDSNVLFNLEGVNSQDVVSYLGNKRIILRSGAHCAKTIHEIIPGIESSIRASIGSYNNKGDIDKLIKELQSGGDFIDFI